MAFIPFTPAGTAVVGLAADTREEAIKRLLFDAAHMPYGSWKALKKRGYEIEEFPGMPAQNPPDWMGYGMAHSEDYK